MGQGWHLSLDPKVLRITQDKGRRIWEEGVEWEMRSESEWVSYVCQWLEMFGLLMMTEVNRWGMRGWVGKNGIFGPDYVAQCLLATLLNLPKIPKPGSNAFTWSISLLVHTTKPLQGYLGLRNFPVLLFICNSSQISLLPWAILGLHFHHTLIRQNRYWISSFLIAPYLLSNFRSYWYVIICLCACLSYSNNSSLQAEIMLFIFDSCLFHAHHVNESWLEE